MKLCLKLGNTHDLRWAQDTVEERHYLHSRVHPQARPMVYVVSIDGERVGLCMAGIPHATKNRLWYGYDDQPTQWQVVDLCRIWLDPRLQFGGELCTAATVPGFVDRKGIFRPTTATWLIHEVLDRVQKDRVSLYPPVFLNQPYHIRLAISYSDPCYHSGFIYKVAGARPMYTAGDGRAVAGPSGKFGWVWELGNPSWRWEDIEILRPRSVSMLNLLKM